MGRKKIYTDEELRLRSIESNKRYRQTKKGKEKQKEAVKKYQQTENFKNYKREYYKRKKENLIEI